MALTKDPSEKKNWVVIYPTYINSKRSLGEGRRIPKEKAIENPLVSEINDVLKSNGLNTEIEERKMYPRDQNRDYHFQGRVRVQLKNVDGSLFNDEFPSRESLMHYAARTIPKLKSRQQKVQGGATQETQGGKGTQKKKK